MSNYMTQDGNIVRPMNDEELQNFELLKKDIERQNKILQDKENARQAVLDKLGLTADEANALLGQFGATGHGYRMRNNTRQHTTRKSTHTQHNLQRA